MSTSINLCIWSAVVFLVVFGVTIHADKYRVCVADTHAAFKKAPRYCPILDGPDSKAECVLGIDRLDCLRKISKGKADFSVFTAEDLFTASNSAIDVLLISELRYKTADYEYEVVAVINEASGIKDRYDLAGKRLCHPGYGYETDWTRIIANYFEFTVVPQTCTPNLTITENRIRASSKFFGNACKAGPWVNNPMLDRQLKKKYSNLCSLCDKPESCSRDDKYWGRRGPLYCLTDGAGDLSWARLDDVQSHFGITPGTQAATPEGFRLLCPDGTTKPVNDTSPCVWVVKPWPVVATKRESAQDIQEFISKLSYGNTSSWQSALLDLIQTYHSSVAVLDPIESIEGYLQRATGFLSANSFTGCHPPRTIRICTTSNLENAKCSWLRESATVYGIEPDLECLKADNKTHCMEALNDNVADVVMIDPDLLATAESKFKLKTLFYETVDDTEKYLTVPVVRKGSDIYTFKDMRGKKACFPSYDGVAWNSVIHTFNRLNLFRCTESSDANMANFFGLSCAFGTPKNTSANLRELCNDEKYSGDYGALKCLIQGADVAFVSRNSLRKFLADRNENPSRLKQDDFRVLCPEQPCHLSWAPVGQAMVRANTSDLWLKDSLDAFLQLDLQFGHSYTTLNAPFKMFGFFDGQSDVLFHDATVKLRNVPTTRNVDQMEREYESVLSIDGSCNKAPRKLFSLCCSLIVVFNVFRFL